MPSIDEDIESNITLLEKGKTNEQAGLVDVNLQVALDHTFIFGSEARGVQFSYRPYDGRIVELRVRGKDPRDDFDNSPFYTPLEYCQAGTFWVKVERNGDAKRLKIAGYRIDKNASGIVHTVISRTLESYNKPPS